MLRRINGINAYVTYVKDREKFKERAAADIEKRSLGVFKG